MAGNFWSLTKTPTGYRLELNVAFDAKDRKEALQTALKFLAWAASQMGHAVNNSPKA